MAILFVDLDGTLTDPRAGIVTAFLAALDTVGHAPRPDPRDLGWIIGPSLIDSFTTLGVADPEAAQAAYRRAYTAGAMYDCRVYDAIPEALTALRVAGHVLYLATAKPHAYARKITAHFGLAGYFAQEFGPELDGTRNDKGELLAHALTRIGAPGDGCVMIGDRVHDIRAARAVGARALAVGWGYGDAGEWGQADALCARPADLPDAVAALLAG